MRGQRNTRRSRQLLLSLKTWGGARKGAGRKRASDRANTPHRARPEHNGAHPLHVTLRAGLRPLRSQYVFPTVRRALAEANSELARALTSPRQVRNALVYVLSNFRKHSRRSLS